MKLWQNLLLFNCHIDTIATKTAVILFDVGNLPQKRRKNSPRQSYAHVYAFVDECMHIKSTGSLDR